MCKIYNEVGCLTAIKSHLHKHKLDEFKSLNELIDFQKNYAVSRQEIILYHKFLIEQEKNILSDEIVQLNYSIKLRKNSVEQQLQLEIENLYDQLDSLSLERSIGIPMLVNYIKKPTLRLRILFSKLTFNFKVTNSLKNLTKSYNERNRHYEYINLCFEDAVNKSSLPQIKEIDRKKEKIDQINNTIYGALGEQKVVRELEKLSDEYILINDFMCGFAPAIYRRKENDYIQSIQIDHILISPSGVFIIETKNWSQHSLSDPNLYSPVQQIIRSNFALYKILNEKKFNSKLNLSRHYWGDRKIPTRNLVVFINQKPTGEYQYVKILTVSDLLSYVNYFSPIFSTNEVQNIAGYLLNLTGKST